jgi:hypothetical protein
LSNIIQTAPAEGRRRTSQSSASSHPKIRCREIRPDDLHNVVNLLVIGFPERTRDCWLKVIQVLAQHRTPAGFPKYGYLLECDETAVGVSLLIFTSLGDEGNSRVRCNICSWYVKPEFRSYASVVGFREQRPNEVTYFNVTPASHTFATLESRGYKRSSDGWFVAVPWLSRRSQKATVTDWSPGIAAHKGLLAWEADLLETHASYGCICVIVNSAGESFPFIFAPRRMRPSAGSVSFGHLVYCRQRIDFVRFAGQLGRFLLRRGVLLTVVDSNEPVEGLVGKYIQGRPKYYKGPDKPRLGDLAYTELAMFGLSDWIWRDWRSVFAEIKQTIKSLHLKLTEAI